MARVAKAAGEVPLPAATAAALHEAAASTWALYLIEHDAHWNTLGVDTYQQHLLYERLYTMAYDDTDALMERVVGLTGTSPNALVQHVQAVSRVVLALGAVSDLHARAVAAERHVEDTLTAARTQANLDGALSGGLDDLLMRVADNRQQALALLGT